MKRQEFVLAVIVALTIPVIFGSIYFVEMYDARGGSSILASLEDKRDEMLLLGDTTIERAYLEVFEDKDYKSAPYVEFSIKYATGMKPYYNFSLNFRDISYPEWEDLENIRWILAQYNEERGTYINVRSGTFRDGDGSSLVLVPNTSVVLMNTEKFRLYYYLSKKTSGDYDPILSGRVALE